MKASLLAQVPVDTARAAQSVFHPVNPYLQIGDNLERVGEGLELSLLYADTRLPPGQAAFLALVTAFQYKEQLTDRQAAEATRVRVDWKYALHLPLFQPGVRASLLCDFRRDLLTHARRQAAFQVLLDRLEGLHFFEAGPAEAGEVLAHLCRLNRIKSVLEAFGEAIEALAVEDPEWLRSIILPHWYGQNLAPHHPLRLDGVNAEQMKTIQVLGQDMHYLIDACESYPSGDLTHLPEIQRLGRVLATQFELFLDKPPPVPPPRWREAACVFLEPGAYGASLTEERCYQD